MVKVSARAPRACVNAGVNLAAVCAHAAAAVGGAGGGHAPAAGATIPRAKMQAFLEEADATLEAQLRGKK
jgi:RecJ-like exonuclease